jgi:hypothetical protein
MLRTLMMEKKVTDVYKFLVGKYLESMPKHRWEDNSEMDLKVLCWC